MTSNLPRPSYKRRKKYLIEKDFQYRFTFRLCLISGVLFAIFAGTALFFIKLSYEMLIQNALLHMPEMVEKLRGEFSTLSLAIMGNWLIFMASIFILGVMYTQKIAGPIFSLKKRLQDLSTSGSTQNISLRKGDEFHSLASAYNRAMTTLEANDQKNIDRLKKIRSFIQKNNENDALSLLNKAIDGDSR